jgi:hypothetical protein
VIWVKREPKYFCKGGLDWWNHVETKGNFFFSTPDRQRRQSRYRAAIGGTAL